MKVYVVVGGHWTHPEFIIKIFSSRKVAEEYAVSCIPNYVDFAEVEDHEVIDADPSESDINA